MIVPLAGAGVFERPLQAKSTSAGRHIHIYARDANLPISSDNRIWSWYTPRIENQYLRLGNQPASQSPIEINNGEKVPSPVLLLSD